MADLGSSRATARGGPEPTLWEEDGAVDVADVVLDVEAPDLQPTYTYAIPARYGSAIRVGVCVHVPFGSLERLGYVVCVRQVPPSDPLCARLREILAPIDGAVTFSAEQADLARWLSNTTLCPPVEAIRCVAPAIMGSRVVRSLRLARPEASPSSAAQTAVVRALAELGGEASRDDLEKACAVHGFGAACSALVRQGIIEERRYVSRPQTVARKLRAYDLADAPPVDARISPAGRRVLDVLVGLRARNELPVPTDRLTRLAQVSEAAIRTLVAHGWVEATYALVRRAPVSLPDHRTTAPSLNTGQKTAAETIGALIDSGESRTALLYGVTASGKTEVYLDAIARTMERGRNAIVLLPEIALTAQVVELFVGRFGDEVAVLHSALSDGERHDEWRRLQNGQARVVVGARSAVFAPIDNVGLLVVDEEHEASYKQESSPRYHARDVALERGRANGAVVVLGSATPSVESFYAAAQGQYQRIDLPERVHHRPLPSVEVVDLRAEFQERKALFSLRLEDAIERRLARKQQVILFLNRRGFAQFVLCRECGYVARCPNCAVSLTYHASIRALKCHHCDFGMAAPSVCPSCGGAKLRPFGLGTERVEAEVQKRFPNARVARLDRDTTVRKGAHAGILHAFRTGQADILIGTQMVAKGLDFPNVTLVGVVGADAGIHVPDFRAAERTFQVLTQVAGRAGRGSEPGEVVVQTFNPDHYSIVRAAEQDYTGFYAEEIEYRRELRYPPFSRLANLICTGETDAAASSLAERLAAVLHVVLPEEVEVLGPTPAPLMRLRGISRWHAVLRAPTDAPLPDLIREVLCRLTPSERAHVTVDIDPTSMA